ncbi:MAG TPA: 3-carboxy-cis,cis-muconate cycloisomerase [Hyphomicrobiaceae bacterium]|nr:3-carboxy-cis,cis-muconate cycloisomerase [Hyphomicrobiaceae bacterium]
MASTVFESSVFRDLFGTPAMRAVFSDETLVKKYIEVEVALARAQARVGVVPEAAAADIARKADASAIDLGKLKSETDVVGYPIVGVVHQMAKQCGDAGRYVHWGATTQDIMDTATVLQLRDAVALVESELKSLEASLRGLARSHRDTVMAGRTHLQQALPVTFGYKAAVWLSMIQRHCQRLEELKPRLLVAQFSGAAGTLASLGGDGLAVQAAFAAELKLAQPTITWHAARDSIAEAVSFLGLVTGSLAKIATDVMLMMQTEVAEVFEPFVQGRGSSSTMPQKRNPISCEMILALAKAVRQHVGLALDAMAADHERATGPWHLEWIAVPESFIATSGALHQANFMLGGLIVAPDRMSKNLGLTGGLIVAEAVMMALAPHIGRGAAHDIVYAACRGALEEGTPLLAQLRKQNEVTAHLSEVELARLVDPGNYVGSAPAMVDRVLNARGR